MTSTRADAERSELRRTVVSRCAAASVVIAGLVLSGCTHTKEYIRNGFKVGPNYERPAAAVSSEWIERDKHVSKGTADLSAWWTVFHDPMLNSLMDDAYRRNLDLKIAAAHLLEAEAQQDVAVSNLLPQSQRAMGTYAHVQFPNSLGLPLKGSSNVWVPGFNASWELDLWGRYRRAVEGRTAGFEANVANFNLAHRDTFRRRGHQLCQSATGPATPGVATEERRDPEGNPRGVRSSSKKEPPRNWTCNRAVSTWPRRNLRCHRCALTVRRQYNQLCLLLGMPPRDLGFNDGPIPDASPAVKVAVGIPADFCAAGPTFSSSGAASGGAKHQIGIAESDLYPRLTLIGFVGYGSNQLSKLFDAHSFLGVIAPSVSVEHPELWTHPQ